MILLIQKIQTNPKHAKDLTNPKTLRQDDNFKRIRTFKRYKQLEQDNIFPTEFGTESANTFLPSCKSKLKTSKTQIQ